MLSLSVFVFAYNEEKALEAAVKEIYETLTELKRPYELIIIDDGSEDKTGKIADELSGELNGVSVIHHERNCGLGQVYKTAFSAARCDLVTFYCGDNQFPATIIKQFLPLIDKTDMVLGYLPKRSDTIISKMLSKFEKALLMLLFGHMPRFQGVLMFKRKLLEEVELKSGGGKAWTVLMELIIRVSRAGYQVISVPTEMRPRMAGKSKVNNLSTIWANFKQAMALRRYL